MSRVKYKKQIEVPIYVTETVKKLKRIAKEVKQNIFDRYRECGQIIIESGWLKGKWNSELREYLSNETRYSLRTIRNMVRLGRASEEEYRMIVKQFPSLHAWANPSSILKKAVDPNPKDEPMMQKKEIPINRFKNEEEARNFFKMFEGEYIGCFYHGTVNSEIVKRRDEFLNRDDKSTEVSRNG